MWVWLGNHLSDCGKRIIVPERKLLDKGSCNIYSSSSEIERLAGVNIYKVEKWKLASKTEVN